MIYPPQRATTLGRLPQSIGAASFIALIAACSSRSVTSVPISVPPETFNNGTMVAARQIPPAAVGALGYTGLSNRAFARSKRLLFACSYLGDSVEVLRQKGHNQQPIREITAGIEGASALFTDRKENLYVANWAGGDITIYPRGSASPSETLAGSFNPDSIAVGVDGTIYVANFGRVVSLRQASPSIRRVKPRLKRFCSSSQISSRQGWRWTRTPTCLLPSKGAPAMVGCWKLSRASQRPRTSEFNGSQVPRA